MIALIRFFLLSMGILVSVFNNSLGARFIKMTVEHESEAVVKPVALTSGSLDVCEDEEDDDDDDKTEVTMDVSLEADKAALEKGSVTNLFAHNESVPFFDKNNGAEIVGDATMHGLQDFLNPEDSLEVFNSPEFINAFNTINDFMESNPELKKETEEMFISGEYNEEKMEALMSNFAPLFESLGSKEEVNS